MLFSYLNYVCLGLTLLSLIVWAFAISAYRVNERRAADDPQKRDFHPVAILLAPISWPLFLFGALSLHVIVRLIIVPLLVASNLSLIVLKKILEFMLEQLKGSERLKHIFLRAGLALFIFGNFFQLIALSV